MSRQRSRRRRGIDMLPSIYGDAAGAMAGSRKVAQLCQQASEALSLALACSADAVLRDLSVVSVSPAPDASRLLVTVEAEDGVEHDRILDKLQVARGYLRSEVAGAIHRKKTPELMFRMFVGPTRT